MMVVWSLKWVGSYHEWAVHKRRSKTASEIMCFQIIRVLHKRHRIREPKVDNFLCWGVSWISKQHSSRVFFFSMSSETRLVSSNPVYTFFCFLCEFLSKSSSWAHFYLFLSALECPLPICVLSCSLMVFKSVLLHSVATQGYVPSLSGVVTLCIYGYDKWVFNFVR